MSSRKKILYLDLDGVVCDFWGKICELHPELVDYQESSYVTKDNKNITIEEYVDYLLEYQCSRIFLQLELLPDALTSYNLLCEYYDVYLLSTPVWCQPLSYADKRVWVEMYLGKNAEKKLILSHNKGLLQGDYLIDDRIKHGVDGFKGEHIHIHTDPKFPDWKSVIKYFKDKDRW